jgi:predicted RNA binding protein YcfA (HicA-like mRNA interferase family)
MPPKLPRVSAEETIRALEHLGFVQIRQRGSHVILQKKTAAGTIGCVVPLHHELAVGTLRNILRQAGVSPEEFIENL